MSDKESKFTPGPWVPGRNPAMAIVLNGHEGKAIYQKGALRHIAWANVYDEEGELCMNEALANAALIAAAPELYAMVKKLADELYGVLAVFAGDGDEDFPLVDEARLLLAKARGEVVEK